MGDFFRAIGNGALLGATFSFMQNMNPWSNYGMGLYGNNYCMPLLMFGGGMYGGHCHHHCHHHYWC